MRLNDHAAIAGFGVALPPTRSQAELWDRFFAEHYGHRRAAKRIWLSCGVDGRHGAADPLEIDVRQWGTERRMQRFMRDAVPLGVRAVENALKAASLKLGDIDQLTAISCTGYGTPGLDVLVSQELGLDVNVQRLHIGHMGCYAALPGLATVADAAVARGQVAVMLCLELSSLHVQPPTTDLSQLIAHALFSDAAVAVAVVPGRGSFKVLDFAALTDPSCASMMTWDVTDLGFRLGLSPLVPNVLARHVGSVVRGLLARHALAVPDVVAWAVHPGGPRILDVVAAEIGLSDDALRESRTVLREHGNCSSPTVLLVLDQILRDRRPAPGEHVVALAFGPGLTLYAALLRADSASAPG